jgi:hypothetical protein
MAKEKKKMQEKPPSLRDKIKMYRKDLHGEVAKKFDEVFIDSCGYGDSLKEALQEGKDLQKAFVAAKAAIAPMLAELHENLDEEDD